VPPTQADSKTSVEAVLEVAHTAVDNAVTYIHYVTLLVAALAIILSVTGVAKTIFFTRFDNKIMSLQRQYKMLEDHKNKIDGDLKKLGMEQEKSLRKLTETVHAVTLVSSRFGVDTRLRALQRLSQQVDPLGIAPLLEVLKDSDNDISLRLEAAYGLGRYSENTAFKEYYPEIFSGFREVLSDQKTPKETLKALALETIKSVKRFTTDSGELAPPFNELAALFKKWEKSDAQT
jgi:hypothetical protein